jgi:hypothetical protein
MRQAPGKGEPTPLFSLGGWVCSWVAGWRVPILGNGVVGSGEVGFGVCLETSLHFLCF